MFYGYRIGGPTRMLQDNLSTIWLATHDGSFGKNKHTIIKRAYVKEKIEEGVVVVTHCDTERMCADLGTKPLGRKLLQRHMEAMGMVIIDNKM